MCHLFVIQSFCKTVSDHRKVLDHWFLSVLDISHDLNVSFETVKYIIVSKLILGVSLLLTESLMADCELRKHFISLKLPNSTWEWNFFGELDNLLDLLAQLTVSPLTGELLS